MIFKKASVISVYVTPYSDNINKILFWFNSNKIKYKMDVNNGCYIIKYEVNEEINKQLKEFMKENNL